MSCHGKPAFCNLQVSKEKSVFGDKEVESVWMERTLRLEALPILSVSSLVIRLTSISSQHHVNNSTFDLQVVSVGADFHVGENRCCIGNISIYAY